MNTTTPTQTERDAAAATIALAQGWEDDADAVFVETYDATSYDAGVATFLVLTDDEADDAARDACERDAWAFRADFLADFTPEGIDADEINAIRGERCEDANDAILALIRAGQGFEEFWTSAVAADGRGHFLAGYDSEEIEEEHDGRVWYGYRTN